MPRFSISDYLRIVGPSLPQELVPKQSFEYMDRIADLLPGAMTGLFGFECRLRADAMQVDLFIRVRPENHEHEVLADRRSDAQLPEDFWAEPVWRWTRDFCRVWADPTSVLHGKVASFWLEFDIEGPPSGVPLPCLFLGTGCLRYADARHIRSCAWLTDEAIRRMTGRRVPPQQERALMNCIRCLPRGANIYVIGAMETRVPSSVRVEVRGLKRERIIPYLSTVGWPGDAADLSRLTEELHGLVDCVDVTMDVGERVGGKVGLECYFSLKRNPANEPRWHDFLEYLVSGGLCTAEKRAALLRYPGLDTEQTAGEQWPEALRDVSADRRQRPNALRRAMLHIKVVYETGRPIEAKAYLAVLRLRTSVRSPGPVPPGTTKPGE